MCVVAFSFFNIIDDTENHYMFEVLDFKDFSSRTLCIVRAFCPTTVFCACVICSLVRQDPWSCYLFFFDFIQIYHVFEFTMETRSTSGDDMESTCSAHFTFFFSTWPFNLSHLGFNSEINYQSLSLVISKLTSSSVRHVQRTVRVEIHSNTCCGRQSFIFSPQFSIVPWLHLLLNLSSNVRMVVPLIKRNPHLGSCGCIILRCLEKNAAPPLQDVASLLAFAPPSALAMRFPPKALWRACVFSFLYCSRPLHLDWVWQGLVPTSMVSHSWCVLSSAGGPAPVQAPTVENSPKKENVSGSQVSPKSSKTIWPLDGSWKDVDVHERTGIRGNGAAVTHTFGAWWMPLITEKRTVTVEWRSIASGISSYTSTPYCILPDFCPPSSPFDLPKCQTTIRVRVCVKASRAERLTFPNVKNDAGQTV